MAAGLCATSFQSICALELSVAEAAFSLQKYRWHLLEDDSDFGLRQCVSRIPLFQKFSKLVTESDPSVAFLLKTVL